MRRQSPIPAVAASNSATKRHTENKRVSDCTYNVLLRGIARVALSAQTNCGESGPHRGYCFRRQPVPADGPGSLIQCGESYVLGIALSGNMLQREICDARPPIPSGRGIERERASGPECARVRRNRHSQLLPLHTHHHQFPEAVERGTLGGRPMMWPLL